MSFVSTVFLWGIAAISIPLLIHLFNRRRRITVPWGAMQFLMADEKTKRRSILKVSDVIPLILRALALIALAIAFARPLVSGDLARNTAPRDVVIVVDNSLSTSRRLDNGGTILGSFKKHALGIISDLGPRDRPFVLATCPSPRWITPQPDTTAGTLPALARDAIRDLTASAAAADFATTISTALTNPPSHDPAPRQVIVLTEPQASGWSPGQLARWTAVRDLTWSLAGSSVETRYPAEKNQPKPAPSLSVTSLEPVHAVIEAGASTEVRATITNHSNQASPQTTLQWSIGTTAAGLATVPTLNPGGSITIAHDAPRPLRRHLSRHRHPRHRRSHHRRQLPVHRRRSPRPRPRPPRHLRPEQRFRPTRRPRRRRQFFLPRRPRPIARQHQNPLALRLRSGRRHPNRFPRNRPVPLCRRRPFRPRRAHRRPRRRPPPLRLRRWRPLGRPRPQHRHPRLQPPPPRRRHRPSPVLLDPAADAADTPPGDTAFHLAVPTPPHEAVALFSDPRFLDLPDARLTRAFPFRRPLPEDASPLLTIPGSSLPTFAVARSFDAGRVIVQATPLGTSWGNLPALSLYVPLVNEWLWHLTAPAMTPRNLAPGTPFIDPRLRAGISHGNTITVTFPGGSKLPATVTSNQGVPSLRFTATAEPGLYTLTYPRSSSENAPDHFTVSRDPAESDPTPLTPEQLATIADLSQITFPGTAPAGLAPVTSDSEAPPAPLREPAWGWFFLLLLIFLALESIVSLVTRHRRARASRTIFSHA